MENKERKHKGRYSYLNDFKLNDNNEYEYKGNIYQLSINEQDKKDLLKNTIIFHGLLIISVIISGFLPYKAMRGIFYVIVPYIFEAIFVFWLVYILFTIFRKDILREYEYNKSFKRIRPFYYVIAINSAIGIGGCISDTLLNGFEYLAIVYGICRLCSTLSSILLVEKYKVLSYELIQSRADD